MIITDYIINYFKYGILGNSIRIDASNVCQLRCPSCPHGLQEGAPFRKNHLRFEDFKKFIEEHTSFKNIELSDNGEILLNPELEQIIQFAHNKKVSLTARNGVNLNNTSEKVLESLAKYNFKLLLVSIDGASNDTHQIYRKGGDFRKVIENIKTINRYKQQYHTKFPVLIWQFILFGHNSHEISSARDMAKKLDMHFFLKLNIDPLYSPLQENVSLRNEINHLSIAEYEEKTNSLYEFPCHQLWLAPQISPQGDLLGCCNMNIDNAYGNVFELGLRQVMKSKKFIYAKRMLLGHEKPCEDIPCFNCKIYQKLHLRKTNLFLTFLSFIKKFLNTHI